MRSPRVHVYPADQGGCGNLRLRWPAMALMLSGHDIRVFEPGADEGMAFLRRDKPDGSISVVLEEAPCDVIVLQRPVQKIWTYAIPAFQAKGVKVVIDIDDDLAAIHPAHVGYEEYHPAFSPDRNWQHAKNALALADRVVATTDALIAKYGHGTGVKIPNHIPEGMRWTERVEHEGIVVGWAGSTHTHPGDLASIGNGLVQARRDTGFEFRVIGHSAGVKAETGLEPELVPWVTSEEYPSALASLDIGIAPLRDHPFTAAKSFLKPLEYAAVGTPFVCSGTQPYREFCSQGVGLIATKPREWAAHLKRLVGDPDLRAEEASRGRQVAARWTIEGNLDRWERAWLDW